ncbi:Coiled-coil domain-containing protein [Wickerhamomyces ciferrii]|uniref:Coiled-coil domain-containing protein n=1 Tax=Wickerhamomyces ciferrii (strain ATCC 14091 / BCRC 22168 / CBS 111 / JCM 3599 / NBRC 0793 / NRRL Y-1031 F-60-10) TaxID=1206466 RepID=K0KHE8_WICCF|nr:Coiled-coil domain-containing protein [Wickerhamomyces ciferrii]CCH41607.1 Coiled-coil domain-containing protein [Wickerhamomyces ciferrii]
MSSIQILYSPNLDPKSPILPKMSESITSSTNSTGSLGSLSTLGSSSAIANQSFLLPKMKQASINNTIIPPHKSPKDISSQYFNSSSNLDLDEIIKEFDAKDVELMKKRNKQAQRQYGKSLAEYGELKLKTKRLEEQGLNGEYVYGQLILKEIEILKFEIFFQLTDVYKKFIESLKDYQDCYNTKTEKQEKKPIVLENYEIVQSLLRQLRFLDLERSKILQLQWPFRETLWGKIWNFFKSNNKDDE